MVWIAYALPPECSVVICHDFVWEHIWRWKVGLEYAPLLLLILSVPWRTVVRQASLAYCLEECLSIQIIWNSHLASQLRIWDLNFPRC
jgi:hypothetical protein